MSQRDPPSRDADQRKPRPGHELVPQLYEQLRRLAAYRLARQLPGQTLQATELVHEAWMRLERDRKPKPWAGRNHFLSAAAEAMRRILVERARRKGALKRGGGLQRVNLEEVDLAFDTAPDVVVLLHELLAEMEGRDPLGAEITKLRFFAGATVLEAAAITGISERTARRAWAYARAWLYHEMKQRL